MDNEVAVRQMRNQEGFNHRFTRMDTDWEAERDA